MSEPVDQSVKPSADEKPAEAEVQEPRAQTARSSARFFCHRCTIEFQDVGQEFTCPFCSSGFVEQLEDAPPPAPASAPTPRNPECNLSALVEGEEPIVPPPPPPHGNYIRSPQGISDLAILLATGLRNARAEPVVGQFASQMGTPIGVLEDIGIGGLSHGATHRVPTGRTFRMDSPGGPFVLVGAPGEYVVGGDSLDAVVAQLLGQLENFGPPPMPPNLIDSIPIEDVTDEQAAANITCSVCWELFKKEEKIARLSCDHFFHKTCIEPWLKLHATCPICRHRLIPDTVPNVNPPAANNPSAAPPAPSNPPTDTPAANNPPTDTPAAAPTPGASAATEDGTNAQPQAAAANANNRPFLRGLIRRVSMGPGGITATWEESANDPFLNSGLVFANITATINPGTNENRPPPTQGYNMDIDYD